MHKSVLVGEGNQSSGLQHHLNWCNFISGYIANAADKGMCTILCASTSLWHSGPDCRRFPGTSVASSVLDSVFHYKVSVDFMNSHSYREWVFRWLLNQIVLGLYLVRPDLQLLQLILILLDVGNSDRSCDAEKALTSFTVVSDNKQVMNSCLKKKVLAMIIKMLGIIYQSICNLDNLIIRLISFGMVKLYALILSTDGTQIRAEEGP